MGISADASQEDTHHLHGALPRLDVPEPDLAVHRHGDETLRALLRRHGGDAKDWARVPLPKGLRGDGAGGHRGARDEVSAAAAREKRRRRLGCRVRLPWDETTSSFVVATAGGSHAASSSAPFTTRVARRRARVGAIDDPVRAMSTPWPPPVGARVRPVETAAETVSPDGDPVPAPGAGPMWARLRYAPPSAGDDRREGMVADVCDDDAHAPTASVVWEDGAEEDGVPLARLGPVVDARPDDDPKTAATNARERGNARFRAGDHAAAAAEYVEACAWLLRAIPTGARAIPGRAEDWRVPGVVDWRAPDADPGPTDDGRVSTAPFRPTVGARVRVLLLTSLTNDDVVEAWCVVTLRMRALRVAC